MLRCVAKAAAITGRRASATGHQNSASCRAGGLSEPAAAACRQLRGLEPQEAAGVMAWLLDELYSGGPTVYGPLVQSKCSCTHV